MQTSLVNVVALVSTFDLHASSVFQYYKVMLLNVIIMTTNYIAAAQYVFSLVEFFKLVATLRLLAFSFISSLFSRFLLTVSIHRLY